MEKINKKLYLTKYVISKLVELKDFEEAADLAENVGLYQTALEIYLSNNLFIKALKLANKYNSDSKKILRKATQYYKKIGKEEELKRELRALEFMYCLKKRFTKKEIQHQAKKKDYYMATRMAEQSGFKELAEKLYKEGFEYYSKNDYHQTARIVKWKGRKKRVKKFYEIFTNQLYEKGNIESASEIAENEGLTEQAIFFYESSGKYKKAAELSENISLNKKAIRNYKKAAQQYEDKENYLLTAAMYDKISFTSKARFFYDKWFALYLKEKKEGEEFGRWFINALEEGVKEMEAKEREKLRKK